MPSTANWAPGIAEGLHWRDEGAPEGAPILFLNSLGTDLRMWDGVAVRLGDGHRLIRMDTRGHGLSTLAQAPFTLDDLVSDAEALLVHAGATNAVVVGISLGGLMAMGLALKRPDLARAIVVMNSAARIGSVELWQERIDLVAEGGIARIAEPILERWFSPDFRATPAVRYWRHMLLRTPNAGYLACCHALQVADITDKVSSITQPTHVVAGSLDGATPPDLVRATADRIPGAAYTEFEGIGHLPPIERPEATATLITDFVREHPA